jgi:histidinol dehydrogenase
MSLNADAKKVIAEITAFIEKAAENIDNVWITDLQKLIPKISKEIDRQLEEKKEMAIQSEKINKNHLKK